jgi:predicted nuclease of restriction endonuclease-like (RecB) superfamily
LLRRVRTDSARVFYEAESLRGGWTVRQLERQIDSQFYERTALSRNKAAMLRTGAAAKPADAMTPEEEIKDPFVLEFLGLKDEYSESELEEALIARLESFLLQMGGDFTFVGRQRRLRIGTQWFRVDLIFFHRRLRCLVIVDLKLGHFTHADAGQMHLYLNYARENWIVPGENPPVGLILCASKEDSVVRYALEGLPNKVLAAEYRTTLPDERLIANALATTRRQLETRRLSRPAGGRERLRVTLTRRLIDDPVVYFHELGDDERTYLTSQRAHLLRQIHEATGLVGEVRREGIALVDPEGTLTDERMPEEGTEGHVTLLIAELLAAALRKAIAAGQDAAEVAVPVTAVVARIATLKREHRTHWRKDALEPGAEVALAQEALGRLEGLRLVRRVKDLVHPLPALGRFRLLEPTTRARRAPAATQAGLFE